MSFDNNGNTFGLYGYLAAPTVSADAGSLAIDTTNGRLYVRDGSDWRQLVTVNDTVVNGGNNVTSTMQIGTTNGHGLSLITNSAVNSNPALEISSGGLVDINNNLDVSGDVSIVSAASIGTNLTVTQDSAFNGAVTLGDAVGDAITVNGVIQSGLRFNSSDSQVITLSSATVTGGPITLTLPAESGTLLASDASGDLSISGALSSNGLTIASGSGASPSFNRTGAGELLSFDIGGANTLSLYGFTGAASGSANAGSLGISSDGNVYVNGSGGGDDWSQLLKAGGNSLTAGSLVIGTTTNHNVTLMANNNTALTIDTTGNITVAENITAAKDITVTGTTTLNGATVLNGTVALGNDVSDSITINGPLQINGQLQNDLVFAGSGSGTITLAQGIGGNITVTLPSTTGTLLTTQDAITNIQDGAIVNADLSSGAFTNITDVGTLTSLSVSGGVTAQTTLDVTGVLSAGNNVDVSGDLSVDGTVTVGNVPAAAGGSNTLCASTEAGSIGQLVICPSLGELKSNVTPLSLGMETLRQLQPKQFTWKGDGQQDLGFIAEEVEAVNPLLAAYDGEGNLTGVKYRHLTALLTQAIQEQQAQLDNLGNVVSVGDGNMGVGKLAHSNYRLDVAGSIRGTSFVESSDERLKKNVVVIGDQLGGNVLSRLQQVDGVYYDWNQQYKRLNSNVKDVPQVGVLAQQVEQVLPRLVDTDSQGYKTVAYSKFVPYLVEGIKELSDQIEPLRQVVQSDNGELSLQANRLKLSDIVIESDRSDNLRIKRSKSLSSLLEVSSSKVANDAAEGYVSTKDVYLADAKMWWSDLDNKIQTIDVAPMDWECQNEQQGSVRLLSQEQLLYICDSNKGWLRKSLSYVGG